jgi:hypothetical protein
MKTQTSLTNRSDAEWARLDPCFLRPAPDTRDTIVYAPS